MQGEQPGSFSPNFAAKKNKTRVKQIPRSLHWLHLSTRQRSINLHTLADDLLIRSSLYYPHLLLCLSAHRETKRWASAMWIHYHVGAHRLRVISPCLSGGAVKLSPDCVGLEKEGSRSKSETTWDLCCLALCQNTAKTFQHLLCHPKK